MTVKDPPGWMSGGGYEIDRGFDGLWAATVHVPGADRERLGGYPTARAAAEAARKTLQERGLI